MCHDVKVLLLGESEKGWSYLVRRLEQNGCHCWFAKSVEEALALFDANNFQLVLSTKPLRLANAIVARLGESNCSAFYCCPVESGCWWLPVVNHGKECLGAPALRPSEFVSTLDGIVRDIEMTALA
jgi:CheY-like chemotaxis protein